MRKTLIDTANMCMARFNASGDQLFAHLGATVVILGGISYDELDSRVWTREEYDAATIGEQAEHAATTKFFNDRHDARVAAGNKSLLGE